MIVYFFLGMGVGIAATCIVVAVALEAILSRGDR